MKKVFFVFIAITVLYQSQAQLVVNLQLPPVALTLKSQLWNMALVNITGQSLSVRVDLTLTDVTNGVTVMTASSSVFNLSSGARQMQLNDFTPITYNVASNNYNIDNTPDGFLPIGHFTICYQFVKISPESPGILADECEEVEIDPISPPILVFPEDEAVIETPRPVFNWIPPAPVSLFSNLNYDLRLVEVMGTQTPVDAVQQNIAIYAEQNINGQTTVYPAGLPALDTGKIYAWQVTAKSNSSFIAKTEVWVFRIGLFGSDGQEYLSGEPFAKLKLGGGTGYFMCTGILKFHYNNYPNDDTVKLSIYNLENTQAVPYTDTAYSLQPGQNFKQIDISAIQDFSANHFYLIELINSRKERWTGKFFYKRED